jgi:hypothetical protein
MRRVLTAVAAIVGLAISGAALAGVYQCVDANGVTTFSDKPCAPTGPVDAGRPVATPATPDAGVSPPPTETSAAAAAVPPAVEQTSQPAAPSAQPPAPSATPAEPATTGSQAGSIPPGVHTRQAESGAAMDMAFRLFMAISLGAWLWLVIDAFRINSPGWGFLNLLTPASIAYPFVKKRAYVALVVEVAATLLAMVAYVPDVKLMEMLGSTLSGNKKAEYLKEPRVRYSAGDTIYMITAVKWQHRPFDRPHSVMWLWYNGDEPVLHYPALLMFNKNPYVLEGYMPAADLGPGPHHVELYIDGEVFDTQSFDINA